MHLSEIAKTYESGEKKKKKNRIKATCAEEDRVV